MWKKGVQQGHQEIGSNTYTTLHLEALFFFKRPQDIVLGQPPSYDIKEITAI